VLIEDVVGGAVRFSDVVLRFDDDDGDNS